MGAKFRWERTKYLEREARRRRDEIASPAPRRRKPMVTHRAVELHAQPCAECTGRIRPGDTYVNRRIGGTWKVLHQFCLPDPT